MKVILDKRVIDIINDSNTHKVIATVNSEGVPHVTFKDLVSIRVV